MHTITFILGFLRRNLAFAPRSIKEVAYKTLVRTKLEYATPVWSRYLKLQINQILESSEDIGPLDLQKIAEHEYIVLAKYLMSLNGHLLMPIEINLSCFSFTRFIVEQCTGPNPGF